MKKVATPELFKVRNSAKAQLPEVLVGEGGPTAAGWHSMGVFLKCPKAYQFENIRGIRIPQAQMPSHFAVGILFAAMRRTWFGLRFDTSKDAWKKMRRTAQREAEEQRLPISARDFIFTEAFMGKYIDHWAKFPRPKPVAAEYMLGPAPLVKDDPFNMFRTGRLDDLSHYPEAGGALCIGEAKTTSGDASGVIREYELHGQPMLYSALYRMCDQGEATHGPVAGVVLDIATKPYENKKPAFSRVFVEIRPTAVEWFVESLRGYIRAMNKIDWDSHVPRNISGCTYMAGRARVDCTYKPLCRFGSSAAGQYVLRDGTALKRFKPIEGERTVNPWV